MSGSEHTGQLKHFTVWNFITRVKWPLKHSLHTECEHPGILTIWNGRQSIAAQGNMLCSYLMFCIILHTYRTLNIEVSLSPFTLLLELRVIPLCKLITLVKRFNSHYCSNWNLVPWKKFFLVIGTSACIHMLTRYLLLEGNVHVVSEVVLAGYAGGERVSTFIFSNILKVFLNNNHSSSQGVVYSVHVTSGYTLISMPGGMSKPSTTCII